MKLVRYVSPFGSPAGMTREEAERYLAEDSALWDEFEQAGALDVRLRAIGAPRIESPR